MAQRITKILSLTALTCSFGFMEAQSTFSWSPAGPLYTAGRARNMIVDKNDPTGNTLYVGSTSSGVFTSTNGGVKWAPVNDSGNVRNISYLAQSKDGIIWVTTGEGFLRLGQKAKAQRGTGLYKLNGSNFVHVQDSNTVGAVINRIACDPNDASRIALATNKGILVSTNGGTSFSAIAGLPTSSLVSGQDVKFSSGGILYCSAGSELSYGGYTALLSKVYRADYALTTLTNITPSNSTMPDFKYGRIELGVAPSNSNVIYASCAAKNTSDPNAAGVLGSPSSANLKGLFVTYDGGNNWGLIVQGGGPIDPLTNGGTLATGDYAQVILVNPNNSDQIFYGGYSFYIFTRTGGSNGNPIGSWVKLGNSFAINTPLYLHENIHDIKIVPGNPTKFYFVTDAGIYRSTDLTSTNQTLPPSFQPFYKGLVTGQFNSVSIERYPIGINTGSTGVAQQSITPYSGFIGGTGGNGLTYYSGRDTVVTQETSYLGGEVYNAEFSRILDGAAIMSTGDGDLYRTSNAQTSAPGVVKVNKYTGATISKVAPSTKDLENGSFTTGTPFKLWENYGQIANTPDNAIFYNDTLRFQYSMSGISTLTTQTTFTFSAARPNKFALIDSVVIRTGTVVLPTASYQNSLPFAGSDLQDITIKLNNYYVTTNTTSIPPIAKVTGPTSSLSVPGITLNPVTQLDNISVTFSTAPFINKTTPFFPTTATSASTAVVPDGAAYYRVFATVFYKYKAGDTVSVIDNNISTKTATYTGVLPQPLRWTLTYTNTAVDPNGPKTGPSQVAVVNPLTNPVLKMPTKRSARLAMILNNADFTANGGNATAIVVSKAPLNLNDPLNLVRVSQHGCRTDNSSGVATNATISILGKATLLEWSKSGTEIYYATNDNKLYRVSHIGDIMDLSPASYSGKFYSDVFTYTAPVNSATLNPACPYRTTLLGTFTKPITSISVSKDDNFLVVTLNNPSSPDSAVMYNTNSIKVSDFSNINWVKRGGNPLAKRTSYCSLMEKTDNKKVLVGTDNGVYYTEDITATSPTWQNINDKSAPGYVLPNVQIFDIKQQLLEPNECYNSSQIYIATNGRGVWNTSRFLNASYVGLNDRERLSKDNSLEIYPNPTNANVTIRFNGVEGETAQVQVMDISGRMVKNENLGKLGYGDISHQLETADLNTGIYIVNVNSSSGLKRVAKLIVTK